MRSNLSPRSAEPRGPDAPVEIGGEAPPMELVLQRASKSYGPVRALRDVDVTFRGGEVHALCGHNGAGKSTLMKVLMGFEEPDHGTVEVDGVPLAPGNAHAAYRAGLAIVDQEVGLVGALTVAENVFLGNADRPLFARPRDAVEDARPYLAQVGLGGLDPWVRLETLQPGQRKLVEIAHVLSKRARMLILDEPTASLSHAEARQVFDAVRGAVRAGAGVIFVSHRLDEVFELCDRVTVMRDGAVVASRPIDAIDPPSLVRLMVGGEVPVTPPAGTGGVGGPAVTITGLRVPPRVTDFDLEVAPGSIVGIAGQIGSGASDVLRALAGLEPASGSLQVDGRAVPLSSPPRMVARGLHYVSNDRKAEGLFLERSTSDNLTATRLRTLTRGGVLRTRARRGLAGRLYEAVGVRGGSPRTPVGGFSGGNQQKVLIGRSLQRGTAGLLLLDDPTRGVDVGGRSEIHDLVRDARSEGDAILFVSTELDELLDLADVIVTMFAGRIVAVRPRSEARRERILAEMTHQGGDGEVAG